MRVHAFLAPEAELRGLLDAGTPPPGRLLTGAEFAGARGAEQELYPWVADGP